MQKIPKNPYQKVIKLITGHPKSALKHPKMAPDPARFQGGKTGKTGGKNPGENAT